MRGLDGRPRGDDDLRAVVKRLNEKIDILWRRSQRQPKIPEIGDSVWGVTRVYVGDPTLTLGSTSLISWQDGAASAFEDVGGTPPALSWAASDYLRVTDAGLYTLTMRGRFWWTIDGTEPTWATANVQGESNADACTQGYNPYVKSTRREIEICHQFGGPWPLAAGDAISVTLQWNSAQEVSYGIGQPFLDVCRLA